MELPVLPNGNWLHPLVQNVEPGICNGGADRDSSRPVTENLHSAPSLTHLVNRRPDRRLGGPVHIPEVGACLHQPIGQCRWQRLPTAEDLQTGLTGPPGSQQEIPGGRRRLHDRGIRLPDQPCQPRPGGGCLLARQHHGGTHRQRSEDLQPGDIERDGGHRQQDIVPGKTRPPGHGGQKVHQGAMGDLHPFRPAGGTRGIDGIGQLFRGRIASGIVRAPAGDLVAIGIRANHRQPALLGAQEPLLRNRRQTRRGPGRIGDQYPGFGVGQHGGQALPGIGRIQRHIGRARLQDP